MSSESRPDALHSPTESSFSASPNLRSHKQLPRPRDDSRSSSASHPAAIQPTVITPPKPASVLPDNEPVSQADNQQKTTPLASPSALNGAETGLPPTPPTNSHESRPASNFSPPPHADGVVVSLMSKNSSLSTPVNQRSPPTPDPSPPRTTESMPVPERPAFLTYPSSRADSFKTAREDQFSSEADSRSSTPCPDRLSTVEEDRGLGLAFERDDDDSTPTNRVPHAFADPATVMSETSEGKDVPDVEDIPDREWDTNLMRNVTVRRKRNHKPSPKKNRDSIDTVAKPASPATGTTPRRTSSLRERIEASKNSPHTPSIENFAQSIGWPMSSETPNTASLGGNKNGDVESKRLSGSSMTSTVVEAMVIVTPPQRRRTLRHSGKNLAYRRDTDSPVGSSATHSNRNSIQSEDVPLHRLVHKRASISSRTKRISAESDTLGSSRYASPLSINRIPYDSSAYTLAHQESVRRVLQPAAEILSRSNSLSKPRVPDKSFHKRISSAPEPAKQGTPTPSSPSRNVQPVRPSSRPLPSIERALSATPGREVQTSPTPASTVTVQKRVVGEPRSPVRSSVDVNKSLPEPPKESTVPATNGSSAVDNVSRGISETVEEKQPPPALLERVRLLLAEREAAEAAAAVNVANTTNSENITSIPASPSAEQKESNGSPVSPPVSPERSRPRAVSHESPPSVRRGSRSSRGRSEERRRSSHSQDRTSTSRESPFRPSLDRVPIEEIPRHSHEFHRPSEEHRRISFDRSTVRTEEHAMARHLFAQTTPFSQFSDTPIEVSEATAVSIFPHNNHSLLVVQQVPRSSTLDDEQRMIADEAYFAPSPPTPPFVDASEGQERPEQLLQPTLTFEPSTPPMQIALPNPAVVDSPLKNPRPPPEPPVIKCIPPTPAEELEEPPIPGPSVPGPPKRSTSHPQRRLSLVQRARRYSDNFISPILARASSTRRYTSEGSARHHRGQVPTVNDEDGTLHPFWRPRGFWDDFEDSDTESEDDVLPQGGDTSEIPEPGPDSSKKRAAIGRRLTNKLKPSEGFLIGNSLGLERNGTNKRRPHISLPANFKPRASKSPKIMLHPPTFPLGPRGGGGIEKRRSSTSLRSSGSYERRRTSRRESWRRGKSIPGLKGVHVQYIGISGVKERLRERRAEKRRDTLRKSIGSRYYIEPGAGAGA